jgi:hypothetical protein
MSQKADIKEFILKKLFTEIVDFGSEAEIELRKHKREVEFYIINILNLGSAHMDGLHQMNPRFYAMFGLDKEQDMNAYKECPISDDVVKKAFAFKLLLGE